MDSSVEGIRGYAASAEPPADLAHYERCLVCDQWFDIRRFDVLRYHETSAWHEPLPAEYPGVMADA